MIRPDFFIFTFNFDIIHSLSFYMLVKGSHSIIDYYIPHPGIGNGRRMRICIVLILAGSPSGCFSLARAGVSVEDLSESSKISFLPSMKVSIYYCMPYFGSDTRSTKLV